MPGLLRGVTRTAVIAGTASAVTGRIQRRQAERFAQRDAQIMAERRRAYGQQPTYHVPPQPAADPIERLRALGELRAQGILTDEEFAAQKARILAG